MLYKPIYNIKICFSKPDEFVFYTIPKVVFAKKLDNNDNNFELAIYSHICAVNRLFAKDNLIPKLVMGQNIARPLAKQELLETKLLKKNNLLNSCIIIDIVRLMLYNIKIFYMNDVLI